MTTYTADNLTITNTAPINNDILNGRYDILTQIGSVSNTAVLNGYGDYVEQDNAATQTATANGPHATLEFIGGGINTAILTANARAATVEIGGGTLTINKDLNSNLGSTKYGDKGLVIGPKVGLSGIDATLNGWIMRDLITIDPSYGIASQADWVKNLSTDGRGGTQFTIPGVKIDLVGVSMQDAARAHVNLLSGHPPPPQDSGGGGGL
jgi:hypothetical protein